MRAFTATSHHRLGGLEPTEIPAPVPGPGQVTIDVRAAGIGLIDAFWLTGAMPSAPGFVPGLEVAGTIREAGAGSPFAPGDPVAAALPAAGGFAEIALAEAPLTARIPEGLDFAAAAVAPIDSMTAHLALTTVARLAPGESLLVHAGVGGLGSQFAQIARALGATRLDAVVGSDAKRAAAERFGYDRAFLRSALEEIPAAAYDIVVDPVGGHATRTAFGALRSGGRLLRVGNASQSEDVALSSTAHWLENKTTAGFNVGGWLAAHPEQGTASLRWVLDSAAEGRIRVELSAQGGPDGLGGLLAALERGDTTGKLALIW